MILHVATSDLATLAMVQHGLDGNPALRVDALVLPAWSRLGRTQVEYPCRYAVNAYLVIDAKDRASAAAWWEEWADDVRTDLKNPFPDDEYAWIDEARIAQGG